MRSLAMGSWWLPAVMAFAAVLVAMAITSLLVALLNWRKLRRLGAALTLGQYLALRWRGVNPRALAAAYWSAQELGLEPAVEDWNSFAVLGVDVLRLAGALAAGRKLGVASSLPVLGAAALAGFDPVEVVKAAHRRGLGSVTAEHLPHLSQWDLSRQERPI